MTRLFNILTIFIMIVAGCSQAGNNNATGEQDADTAQEVKIPVFNADSAYYFVEKQTGFGPRVPNSEAHRETGRWLAATMESFADTLYIQETRVRAYDGTTLNIKNMIGVFQPDNPRRILLCAHWDSRPFADYDPDPDKHYTPIDGANDGGSGVGVLLEIARQLQQEQPAIGVDIIFFDAEDYGRHRFSDRPNEDSWALGAQYWARNPHRADYLARYGILLDMVGASGATFKKEGYSMLYAPGVVRKVWDTAQDLGYGDIFADREGSYITDDHYYVNTIRNIPTINIIHQETDTEHGFFPEWHTTDDTIDIIDRYTLKAAGETVISVIYNE